MDNRDAHDHDVAVYLEANHWSPLRSDSKDLKHTEMQEKAKFQTLK